MSDAPMTITTTREGGEPENALQRIMREALEDMAREQSVRAGGARPRWFALYTADDAPDPDAVIPTLIPLPPLHEADCTVCQGMREMARRGATVMLHVFQGFGVFPIGDEEMSRYNAFRAAGGRIHEHPRRVRTLTALGFMATSTTHISLRLDSDDPSKTTGDVYTVLSGPGHPFNLAAKIGPEAAAKIGEMMSEHVHGGDA